MDINVYLLRSLYKNVIENISNMQTFIVLIYYYYDLFIYFLKLHANIKLEVILQQYRVFYIFTLPPHIPRMWVIFYPGISPSWVKSSCLRHLNSRRCLEYYAKSRVSLWLRKRIRQFQSLPRGESRENYFTSLFSLSLPLSIALSLSLFLWLSLMKYGKCKRIF